MRSFEGVPVTLPKLQKSNLNETSDTSRPTLSRRDMLAGAAGALAASAVISPVFAAGPKAGAATHKHIESRGARTMSVITTKDGTEIYFEDWGTGQPIVFHHGWPLSSDDWDAQMLFFLQRGFRLIAHDRRGHGRSTQTANGHDMDTYAADVAELVKHLDLKNAIHVGHSTGGGEVIRYVAKHGKGRVAKAVLISATTPLLAKTESNPQGIPIPIFDEIRSKTATQRQQYFQDFTLPFYGYNREGARISQGVRDNWWRQGMMGAIKAHYDCIKAFSETDHTEDLQQVDIPVLVMHGEDDQIVPFEITGARAVKLLKHGK